MQRNSLTFTKMHGLGNDFVVINNLSNTLHLTTNVIRQLADRHLGIGFDQLLQIEPTSSRADFFCRIFNADGSEAELCVNGLRCVARYLHEEKLHTAATLNIETIAGIFLMTIKDYDHIQVTINAPRIEEKKFPLTHLPINDHICILSLGNPHAILKVASIEGVAIDTLGPLISAQSVFPHGANVGFMEVVSRDHIRLRTFERGAGQTHACGSNAAAAAVASIVNNWCDHQLRVEYGYGSLLVNWEGEGQPIHLVGPAASVFSGEIDENQCNPF